MKKRFSLLLIKTLIIFSVLIVIPIILFADSENKMQEKYADKNTLKMIQEGGYVLYFRHGKTDSSKPDQYPIDLNDCNTQRPLTAEGENEIIKIGEAIRKANIKIYQVYCSPLCRAKKSAELLFGDYFIVEEHLMYTAHLTSEQKIPVIAKTRELLSCNNIPKGKNRALVAHAPNIADLIDYFPETEGSLLIFKPLGEGQFEYIATILPNQWNKLIYEE